MEIRDLLDGLLTLDCEKRLKASTALEFAWLRSAVMSFQSTNWFVACLVQSVNVIVVKVSK